MPARVTPATRAAKAAGVDFRLHEYTHDPGAPSFALEAAQALKLDPARVLKTLVVTRALDCVHQRGATRAGDGTGTQ